MVFDPVAVELVVDEGRGIFGVHGQGFAEIMVRRVEQAGPLQFRAPLVEGAGKIAAHPEERGIVQPLLQGERFDAVFERGQQSGLECFPAGVVLREVAGGGQGCFHAVGRIRLQQVNQPERLGGKALEVITEARMQVVYLDFFAHGGQEPDQFESDNPAGLTCGRRSGYFNFRWRW